ncbi:MAG TPA: patatin-like phospholipase family protein [Longimicrobium sp.]|jgi:predicted acylesterase/phospholipase RssA
MTEPHPAAPAAPPAGAGPLGDLALSFSGGGYRAAAFHLGALRLLDRVGLLPGVVALSTVSGGSIVGAAWVMSVVRGEAFAAFERRFADFLRRTDVMRDALEHLTSHREHGHPDYPSLIRSAARVYARPELFGDTRLAEVAMAGGSEDFPRFREVIFNSTEFRTGVDFRFRRSANPRAHAGNGNLPLPRAVAERVRVADAVAASSCFPGGFEPLLFPDHFAWPADFPLDRVQGELGAGFAGGVALMDGGVYDNQGVDSLVLAFERGGAATLLVSDVAARKADLYDFPPRERRGFLKLRGAAVLAWIVFLAAVVSAGMLALTWADEWREGERGVGQVFLYGVPFLFAAAVAGGLFYLRLLLRDVQRRLRESMQIANVWRDLRKLTVRELIGMVDLRVTSLLALTSSIFMKRIRGLVDTAVYRDPKYEGRRMMNLIYALEEDRPKLFARHPWLRPSQALRELAARAEQYPTTLWFNRPEDLDMLVRAGEATTCFTLLRFVLGERGPELEDPGSPVAELLARLRREWDAFNGAAAGSDAAPAA